MIALRQLICGCALLWALSTTAMSNDLRIGSLRAGKILFLGNSITLHGPAPEIGWNGNWGMAATSQDKDYVHLLLNHLAQACGGQPEIMVKNIADFERTLTSYNIQEELKAALAFEADIVILAIGENAASPKTDEAKEQFSSAFRNLLAELNAHGKPVIFVRSQFWPDAEKDSLMKTCCEEVQTNFVDIGPLGAVEANYARAEQKIEHDGVAGHPGNKGMQALADALWAAIETRSKSRL